MAYSKQTWTNGSSKLNATRMQHIEDGLETAAADADSAQAAAVAAQATADAAIPKAIAGVATDKVPVYNGSSWVAQKIGNAQIDAAAAIAYSKLNLATSIVNADISASAAIALSKLAASAFTTYTPTWSGSGSNPAIGNGTITGRYLQIAKLVVATAQITAGSTTTFGSGNLGVSMPVTANDSSLLLGVARFVDTGTANYHGTMIDGGSGKVFGVTGTSSLWTPTSPFTMANGDVVTILVIYEAA